MKDLTNNNVIHIKDGNMEYLQFRKLLQFPNIKHAYTLKPQNYRTVGDENQYNETIKNYIDLCNKLEIDYNTVVKPEQKHTGNVQDVKKVLNMDVSKNYLNTDGLITNQKSVCLATTNADCILLLFYDPVNNVIANIHSGWRGTIQKIAETVVKGMMERYKSKPENIICCICPSIRKCHFEVEVDVKNIFENTFKYTGRINEIIEYQGKKQGINCIDLVDKWSIDTVQINKILLKDCGLLEENIIDCGICSVCNSEKVHSCRADGKNFGLATAIIEME